MTKTTLLMLPGLLCDEAVWLPQRAALTNANCIIADYGHSDSLAQMARVALAAADAAHAARFAVAGHSMGGRVALELARIAPERIERMALLDTGVAPLAPGDAGHNEVAGRMALLELARQEGMRAMGQQWARGMVHPARLDTPLFEEILAMIGRKTPDIFAAQLKALIERPDARDMLANLSCPTLLLCGREDAWSPLARHEEMQRLCPRARLAVIEQCGHMSTMEQPEAVTQALAQWLRASA